jgi:predicted dehydrogenase
MTQTPACRVGLVGTGFLARTRARCYGQLPGGGAVLKAVTSRDAANAQEFAKQHGVEHVSESFEALIARDDIDLVDLCVPNHLHRPFTEAAAKAGIAVACTKPLTAYVGQDLTEPFDDADVSSVDPRQMARVAIQDASAMVQACRDAKVPLLYGENWIHAPSVRRAEELLRAHKSPILDIRGWECHNGSHSPYSKLWKYTGGGSLVRLAAHPIGAMVYLKEREGLAATGKPIRALSVIADTANPTALLDGPSSVAQGWVDVETWASVSIAFSDGSRGLALGADTMVGGMQSRLVVLTGDGHLECNISPHDALKSFGAEAQTFGDSYVMEKAGTHAGWNTYLPDEDHSSGHTSMCADFVAAVREKREGRSSGDLGLEVTRIVSAAYCSAAEGRRVTLDEVTP